MPAALAVCEPADAGAVGALTFGADSSWAMSAAVSLTGLGTGYSFGIDPR